ncbi:parasitic stage specific protein 1 [Aphelenchoides avenae]|nr:parasitic stage specific protein 1 [Aphelenchus avenae]
MFSPLIYVLRLLSASLSQCVDGVNNLVKLEAPPDVLPVTFSSPILTTYDGAGTPACYNGRGNIQLPGTVQLINGSFTVHKGGLVQFGKTKAMVTLVKNSFIVGSLCKDGKSTSMFLADSYW